MILPSEPFFYLVPGYATVVVYALAGWVYWRGPPARARSLVLIAWLLHGTALLIAMLGLDGQPLRFGFAPALSITAWLVIALYGIESRRQPRLRVGGVLAVLGAFSVALALIFPGSALHPSASIWLPLHSALGIASYGLFAAAVLNAWLMTRAERQVRLTLVDPAEAYDGVPFLTLERMTFRFVIAGFVLLSATLLAAGLFTESLYGAGKTVRLDHKTVFSVLSWVTFAWLLAGRARFGWRGRKAVRFLYVGAGLLLLAYVGSRFVLEVILRRTP